MTTSRFHGSITPKGTGRPDFTFRAFGTLPTEERGGSVDIRRGSLGRVNYIGSLGYVRWVGSLGSLGRVRYVGSSGNIRRVGSIGTLGRVNYVVGLGTIQSRQVGGTVFFGSFSASANRHIATGSTRVGIWTDVSRFRLKTFMAQLSMGGSFHIITGFRGTGVMNGTGTYYSTRSGVGSYTITSFQENVQFVRGIVRSGSSGSGKGTVIMMLNLQV